MRHLKKHILLAALGAIASTGGFASPVTSTGPAADEKIKLKDQTTGQVCEFDTREQVETFGRGLEANGHDTANWRIYDEAAEQAAQNAASGEANPTGYQAATDAPAHDPLGQRGDLLVGEGARLNTDLQLNATTGASDGTTGTASGETGTAGDATTTNNGASA